MTAADLAAGHWSNVAGGPKWFGNPTVAAAWVQDELLVVGYGRAAAYDPATNKWHSVSRPPAGLHTTTSLTAVATAGRVYVITWPGNRVAVWDKRPDTWRMLPRFPACKYCQTVLVGHRGKVIGVSSPSRRGSGVAELRAGRWVGAAAVPVTFPERAAIDRHAARPIPQIFAGYVGGRLYALAAMHWQARGATPGLGPFAGSLQLFKQVGGRWQKISLPNLAVQAGHSYPVGREIVDWAGHLELVVAALCNGFEECTDNRPRALVVSTDGQRHALSAAPPVSDSWFTQPERGDVLVALPSNAGAAGKQWPTDRPSAAALDLETGDWLALPSVPHRGVFGLSLVAWTPYGPAVFWAARTARSSGAILRLARDAR